MAKLDILIEGYARNENDHWYASPSTVFIEENNLKIIVDPGANKERLMQALAERNINTGDVDMIFLTHYHLDHIFNLRLFPDAVLCNGESIITDEKMFDYSRNIPGTSIEVVYTPGHDDSHWSLIVPTDGGKVAIAGDVFWWQEHEEQKTCLPELLEHEDPFVKDRKALQQSRETLIRLVDFIIPGHGKRFSVPEELKEQLSKQL